MAFGLNGMERLESTTKKESFEAIKDGDVHGTPPELPEKSPDEEYLSLEYEDYSFVCITNTPSFDEVSEIEGFSLIFLSKKHV